MFIRFVLEMSTYTNNGSREIAKEKLKHVGEKKKTLRVFARIALLFVKFHKRTTEKYKNVRIKYIFDRAYAIRQLRQDAFAVFPDDCIYLIRKFGISLEEICYSNLRNNMMVKEKEKNDPNTEQIENKHYAFTLALKYLCRNSKVDLTTLLNPLEILEKMRASNNSLVNNQLVRTLGYIIEKSNERVTDNLSSKINELIQTSSKNLIDDSSRAFLFSLMESNNCKSQ